MVMKCYISSDPGHLPRRLPGDRTFGSRYRPVRVKRPTTSGPEPQHKPFPIRLAHTVRWAVRIGRMLRGDVRGRRVRLGGTRKPRRRRQDTPTRATVRIHRATPLTMNPQLKSLPPSEGLHRRSHRHTSWVGLEQTHGKIERHSSRHQQATWRQGSRSRNRRHTPNGFSRRTYRWTVRIPAEPC